MKSAREALALPLVRILAFKGPENFAHVDIELALVELAMFNRTRGPRNQPLQSKNQLSNVSRHRLHPFRRSALFTGIPLVAYLSRNDFRRNLLGGRCAEL
jgi:hypothetical protein